jgi:hypothetical protein
MNKIFIHIKPFEFSQEIKVDNDEMISTYGVSLADTPEKIADLSNLLNIDAVELYGIQNYNEEIKRAILQVARNKYNKQLNIKLF